MRSIPSRLYLGRPRSAATALMASVLASSGSCPALSKTSNISAAGRYSLMYASMTTQPKGELPALIGEAMPLVAPCRHDPLGRQKLPAGLTELTSHPVLAIGRPGPRKPHLLSLAGLFGHAVMAV